MFTVGNEKWNENDDHFVKVHTEKYVSSHHPPSLIFFLQRYCLIRRDEIGYNQKSFRFMLWRMKSYVRNAQVIQGIKKFLHRTYKNETGTVKYT